MEELDSHFDRVQLRLVLVAETVVLQGIVVHFQVDFVAFNNVIRHEEDF